jgi:hypothetical protein
LARILCYLDVLPAMIDFIPREPIHTADTVLEGLAEK